MGFNREKIGKIKFSNQTEQGQENLSRIRKSSTLLDFLIKLLYMVKVTQVYSIYPAAFFQIPNAHPILLLLVWNCFLMILCYFDRLIIFCFLMILCYFDRLIISVNMLKTLDYLRKLNWSLHLLFSGTFLCRYFTNMKYELSNILVSFCYNLIVGVLLYVGL